MPTTNRLVDPGDGNPVAATGCWAATNGPTATRQATVTQVAGDAGVRNVCRSITATVACGATAQTPLSVFLRDGATGVGAILWQAVLAAPADGSGIVNVSDLEIVGSPATPMTLEFSAGGVAASLEAVSMSGFLAIQ